MRASPQALEIIKQFEGFCSVPYLCPAGKWTIGYGHTEGVSAYTMPITEASADALLLDDVAAVEAVISGAVKVTLSQPQIDALVSFAYNVGGGNFRRSTLLKKINAGDVRGAALEFHRWVYAGGKRQRGLEKRRKAEAALFAHSS